MYCPAGHSVYESRDCKLCTKEHFIQEFTTWSSGNVEIDKVIQKSQANNGFNGIQWVPYDNFRDIKHIADGGYGSVYSAILKDCVKFWWNFDKQDWEYNAIRKVALKEIRDSRHDISEFFKEAKNLLIANNLWDFIAKCIGITKNPSTENYIIVMRLYDDSLHKFLTKNFGRLRWKMKIDLMYNIAAGLYCLRNRELVHRDLHSGNVLTSHILYDYSASITDLGLCVLENDQITKSDNKRDIYSFGGIMYEMATGKQPFYDRAHDTRLIIDICNGVRPNIPYIMLDWIPKWYSDLMYKCWNGDPSKRPTVEGLFWELRNLYVKLRDNEMDDDIQQFIIADENQKKKDIKSGKSQDPNLLKSNESTSSSISTYDIDSKESKECIDWEKENQKHAKKRSFSTLDCDSEESKECINLNKDDDNITLKKVKKD
ncbi:hypothetical protein Glove_54g40 [Diversispora epigaea]|uniref:Protein kinase domain-containing protein n=1 Tax=Diversispora epigaea TaxID=1348612 RepID=A0A397JDG4_9GLOM|nr:hypothetical protein Glove_54g40 [Diversispora epigaea]